MLTTSSSTSDISFTEISSPESVTLPPTTSNNSESDTITETVNQTVDDILEMETQQNSKETWTKLNRTIRVQILHKYAETYGKENALSVKDVKSLKRFLSESLDAKKLSKVKDVVYNRTSCEIEDIPGLFFHPTNKMFTIRTNDRQSTLKSLTPRRFTEKNTSKN